MTLTKTEKPETQTTAPPSDWQAAYNSVIRFLGSVRLAVTLLSLTALTVLIGAWCPQESQVGQQKVIDQFGEQFAQVLINAGISDIFHSVWFLVLIGFLTVSLVAASFQRVFPKLILLRKPPIFLKKAAIEKLPISQSLILPVSKNQAMSLLAQKLKKKFYKVYLQESQLAGEQGKFGRLAPSVTHVGLLSLLCGVTITSWTGFSGFQPVRLGDSLSFADSEHSKLWIGKLPNWRVKVEKTEREDYPSGDPKQWYSDLVVIDSQGKPVKRQQISVNNPLTYDGVDIYQSSWGLDTVALTFNDHKQELELRPMGKLYAAFLPLGSGTILIFSARNQTAPLRVFGKTPNWQAPKLLAEISPNQAKDFGSVKIQFNKVVPVTGLQYKCDPALPLTYTAFGFIMLGVLLASVPYRQVWAQAQDLDVNGKAACQLVFGGTSYKAKQAFEKDLQKIAAEIEEALAQEAQSTKIDDQKNDPENEGNIALCPTSN
jgi:cytochrome c biogenesis protein